MASPLVAEVNDDIRYTTHFVAAHGSVAAVCSLAGIGMLPLSSFLGTEGAALPVAHGYAQHIDYLRCKLEVAAASLSWKHADYYNYSSMTPAWTIIDAARFKVVGSFDFLAKAFKYGSCQVCSCGRKEYDGSAAPSSLYRPYFYSATAAWMETSAQIAHGMPTESCSQIAAIYESRLSNYSSTFPGENSKHSWKYVEHINEIVGVAQALVELVENSSDLLACIKARPRESGTGCQLYIGGDVLPTLEFCESTLIPLASAFVDTPASKQCCQEQGSIVSKGTICCGADTIGKLAAGMTFALGCTSTGTCCTKGELCCGPAYSCCSIEPVITQAEETHFITNYYCGTKKIWRNDTSGRSACYLTSSQSGFTSADNRCVICDKPATLCQTSDGKSTSCCAYNCIVTETAQACCQYSNCVDDNTQAISCCPEQNQGCCGRSCYYCPDGTETCWDGYHCGPCGACITVCCEEYGYAVNVPSGYHVSTYYQNYGGFMCCADGLSGYCSGFYYAYSEEDYNGHHYVYGFENGTCCGGGHCVQSYSSYDGTKTYDYATVCCYGSCLPTTEMGMPCSHSCNICGGYYSCEDGWMCGGNDGKKCGESNCCWAKYYYDESYTCQVNTEPDCCDPNVTNPAWTAQTTCSYSESCSRSVGFPAPDRSAGNDIFNCGMGTASSSGRAYTVNTGARVSSSNTRIGISTLTRGCSEAEPTPSDWGDMDPSSVEVSTVYTYGGKAYTCTRYTDQTVETGILTKTSAVCSTDCASTCTVVYQHRQTTTYRLDGDCACISNGFGFGSYIDFMPCCKDPGSVFEDATKDCCTAFADARVSYNISGGSCVPVPDLTGMYPTIRECQKALTG